MAAYPLLDRLAAVALPVRVMAADDDLFGHLAPAAAAVAGTSVHRVTSKWSGRAEAILMLLPMT